MRRLALLALLAAPVFAQPAPDQGEASMSPALPRILTLRERADVQNIDLMNLSGFCRNCLSKWYLAAAEERGVAGMDYDLAREIIGPQRESFDDLSNVRLEITVVEGEGAVVPMIALTENGTGDVIVRME